MDLKTILRREVEGYARKGFTGYGVFFANDEASEHGVILQKRRSHPAKTKIPLYCQVGLT